MKFAHIADCHIGGWRDYRLQDLTVQSFSKAISISIQEKVDFILIAGDLFNTSIPSIDKIKSVVTQLKKLKKEQIPVYLIPGSHDFSPSGKTMLDVLEEADLFINVWAGKVIDGALKLDFTNDSKTDAKITGILGKKGMLDKNYYQELLLDSLEKEDGFKIFLFHTAITQMKPSGLERMDSSDINILPKGFDYYAGGHVHIVNRKDFENRKNIVFPGPTFPNSFSELETLKNGGMYIYENGISRFIPIQIKDVESIILDCNGMHSLEVEEYLLTELKKRDVKDKIVTLRLKGTLSSGKTIDIDFSRIFQYLKERNSYFVLKNTSALKSREYEEIKISHNTSNEIEEALLEEQWGELGNVGIDKRTENKIMRDLMLKLSSEKQDGETVSDYELRITEEAKKILSEIIKYGN